MITNNILAILLILQILTTSFLIVVRTLGVFELRKTRRLEAKVNSIEKVILAHIARQIVIR